MKLRIKTDRKQFELKDNEKEEENEVAMETDKQDVVSNNALDEDGEEDDCKKSEVSPRYFQNVIYLTILTL